MNKLIIPPSPNWYESYALACAPDNTIIYGSRNEIIVILPKPPEEPADVKVIAGIHSQRVVCVVISPSWGNPDKLAVSVAEDNVVRLLDIQSCTSKLAHVGHTTRSDKIIGATFAGDDKVISVSEAGFIIIWRIAANHLTSISDVLGSKAKVSCISSCPHAPWLTAFGLKKGTIVITDLRKTGTVLYRLTGHDSSITSISWCPAPFNIFPKRVKKTKEIKRTVTDDKTEAASIINDNLEGVGANTTEDSSIVPVECKDIENLQLEKDVPPENTDEVPILVVNDQPGEFDINKKSEVINNSDELKKKDEKLIPENEETSILVTNEKQGEDTPLLITNEEQGEQKLPTQTEVAQDCTILVDIVIQPESTSQQLNADQRKVGEVQSGCQEASQEFQPTQNEEANVDSEGSGLKIKPNTPEEQNSLQPDCKNQESEDITQNAESPTKEFLLASTARGGGSIKIWRAGTDGLQQTELYIPGKPRLPRSHRNEDKPWIAICWVTPKDLLSSSHKGELLHWKFPFEIAADGKVSRWRLIHGDHHKHLFSIAAPTKIYESLNEEEWKDKPPFNAWTMGKDRFILNTSLCVDHKTLALYPTIGGIITCLAASPIDPTRIAMATGDGTCRMWDLSRPHLQHIVMTQMSDRTQIKITSLAWHPSKEVCLAFGTFDGRVGLMDANNTSKGTKFLVQSFHGAVYKIEWGPLNGDREVLGLYAVASGNLLAYDIDKSLHEPTKFDFDENCVTHFAWKPDYSILAVGTKTGDVMLYSTKLKFLTTLLLQNKGVRWMTWHPEGTPEDSWLAVSTNNVIVYDCSSVSENSVKQKRNYEECTVAMFTEHTHYVQCLAWSPHEGGMLASASEDGTALVWNVKTKTLLHSCVTSNLDMLNTVLWSPLDHDYLITGGRDCMIQIWKLSENPPKPKIGKKPKLKLLTLEGEEKTAGDGAEAPKIEAVSKKSTRKYLLAGIAQTQNPNIQSALLDDCERLFATLYEKTENDTVQNGHVEEEQTKFDALQLFGGKEDIDKILQLEKATHQKKIVPLHYESVTLWQGDIGDTIKKAITAGTLNAWLVGIAPMISFSLWQEASEAYANQLSEACDSRSVEAAYFYLACHKVEAAIETLCSASYFREALILAKCRLQPNDPIIKDIVERWAKFCMSVGNFEVSAQCYIALNQLEEAAKVLFRRTDVPTLKFCVKLAEHCNNKDLLEATQFRLNAFSGCELADKEKEVHWLLIPRTALELISHCQQNGGGDDTSNGQHIDTEKTSAEVKDCTATVGDGQCPVTLVDKDDKLNMETAEN